MVRSPLTVQMVPHPGGGLRASLNGHQSSRYQENYKSYEYEIS
eukprot:CAMPEP_0196236702 /NCGR_PEP_ID=MMETSP0913-20130531/6015_1 /TAXON_ID=49265 /ORGANISM="Thalassiosira rotula, Strain GSO102" /LENGTH=42 /DNA_ID= /DNA_START= /DNA_END= /DNA_ORIENTATION=